MFKFWSRDKSTYESRIQAIEGLLNIVENRRETMAPAIGKFSSDTWITIIRNELLLKHDWDRAALLKMDYVYKDTLTDDFIYALCGFLKSELKRHPLWKE